MRWKYPDPSDLREARGRQEIIERMAAWWKAFAEREHDIRELFSRRQNWDLAKWMEDTLCAVDSRICYEFGPAVCDEGERLCITAEAERQLRPMVEVLLQRAPKLKGWEFYYGRVPEPADMVVATVQGRMGIDITGTRVVVARGEHNVIGLTFLFPWCSDTEDKRGMGAAFMAAEALLGEERLDKWIGEIKFRPMPKGFLGFGKAKEGLELGLVKDVVDRQIEAIRQALPQKPFHTVDFRSGTHGWHTFEIRRELPDWDDFPCRSDICLGSSGCYEVSSAAASRYLFSSSRFSRCGEIFCYLKIDGGGASGGARLEQRGKIQDAVDEALGSAQMGRVLAGAMGKRYSYVDLAVMDPLRAMELIREAVKGLELPERTWLLFLDAGMEDEWVGLTEGTPEPPGWPAKGE